jgi:CubicO group peptidase (beta-lactamase class C family)
MFDNDVVSRRALLATSGTALLAACTGKGGVLTQGAPREQSQRSPSPAAQLNSLDLDFPRMMSVAGVPGLSIATVDGDRVAARGIGVTRAGGTTAVSADTVVEAASLSKPVFAYLVMRLASEGTLDLDKPLSDYLPLPNPGDARAKAITARHALSHSTGWRNWRNTMTQPLTADFEPGSRFGYSGEGFYFLQRVVERVTGRGILRLTRDRVFEPLGMTSTAYLWAPEMEPRRAEPHTARGVPGDSFGARNGKALREFAASTGKSLDDWTHEEAERYQAAVNKDQPVLPNFLLPNVAGSMLTTATDYARFLRHLLAGEGRAMLERMLAPQTPINDAVRWGLGVGLQSSGGRAQFWHWGDNFGYKNFFVADSTDRTALVVFANGQNGRAIYERVVRAVRGDQPAFLWI